MEKRLNLVNDTKNPGLEVWEFLPADISGSY